MSLTLCSSMGDVQSSSGQFMPAAGGGCFPTNELSVRREATFYTRIAGETSAAFSDHAISGGIHYTSASAVSEEEKAEFDLTVEGWLSRCRYKSSVHDRVDDPGFKKIAAMGRRAVPLILRHLEERASDLFLALHRITGADPVPYKYAGQTAQVVKAWLRWGKKRGYR